MMNKENFLKIYNQQIPDHKNQWRDTVADFSKFRPEIHKAFFLEYNLALS